MTGAATSDLLPLEALMAPGDDYAPPGDVTARLDPAAPPPVEGPFISKFGGASVHDLLRQAPKQRDWLLKNALAARAFHLVLGAPGCGKSFLVTDMAMMAARCAADPEHPREWFGLRVKPTGVVYIAAEGQEDFVFRLKAWWQAERLPEDFQMPFYLVPRPVDLRSEMAQTADLAAEIKHISALYQAQFDAPVELVIVDTVNRSLAGGDDAKADVIGAFIKNCTALRDQCGVAVVGVHHLPKADGATDPRGHSSLKGDNDGQWLVRQGGGGAPNTWTITRLKAGPTGSRHEFRLRQEVLGRDDDGDEITSCVVARLGSEPSLEGAEARDTREQGATGRPQYTADGRAILGDNLTSVVRALAQALDHQGVEAPVGVRCPHGRKAVTHRQWLDEIVRGMPGEEKDTPKFRDRCRKARDAAALRLRSRGVIGMDGDYVWRTNRRIASVDPAVGGETLSQNSEDAAKSSDLLAEVSGSFG